MTGVLKRRITVKSVIGKVIPALKKAGLTEDTDDENSITGVTFEPDTPILRVIGQVTGYATGDGDFGPWVRFKGDFHAVNLLTGEDCRSRACHVPGVIEEDIVSALQQEGNTAVEFAVDVVVSPVNSAQGYSYDVRPLVDVARDDPLSRLKSLVSESHPLPTLGAPDPEPVAKKTNTKKANTKKSAAS